jgi:hypothetical protein
MITHAKRLLSISLQLTLIAARYWSERRPGMPLSIYLFAATGVIFMLQLFPLTGVFLMILMAPFWSIVTINGGFLILALESISERVSRLWILAPIAWLGGYAVAAALNHWSAHALSQDILNENAGKTLPSVTGDDALLVLYRNADGNGLPRRMIHDYQLRVVYESGSGTRTLAYRANPAETCSYAARARRNESRCINIRDETAPPGLVEIAIRTSKPTSIWLPRRIGHIRITDGSARAVELQALDAEVLRWFPMPVVGCSLISSVPEWSCAADFMREPFDEEASSSNTKVIAAALGLQAYPISTKNGGH